jgi:hypothetical protein
VTDEGAISRATAHYPRPDMTAAEAEVFVMELIRASEPTLSDLEIQLHEEISGMDGDYDFDGTVRFTAMGAAYLTLVEVKLHRNPIKRDLVMILNQKKQSVGAHKAVMFSSSQYQSGALDFAIAHGIGLATMTEGRFTFEVRAQVRPPALSRAQAAEMGIPTFVAHHYEAGSKPGSFSVSVVSTEYPREVARLLGVPGSDRP